MRAVLFTVQSGVGFKPETRSLWSQRILGRFLSYEFPIVMECFECFLQTGEGFRKDPSFLQIEFFCFQSTGKEVELWKDIYFCKALAWKAEMGMLTSPTAQVVLALFGQNSKANAAQNEHAFLLPNNSSHHLLCICCMSENTDRSFIYYLIIIKCIPSYRGENCRLEMLCCLNKSVAELNSGGRTGFQACVLLGKP